MRYWIVIISNVWFYLCLIGLVIVHALMFWHKPIFAFEYTAVECIFMALWLATRRYFLGRY